MLVEDSWTFSLETREMPQKTDWNASTKSIPWRIAMAPDETPSGPRVWSYRHSNCLMEEFIQSKDKIQSTATQQAGSRRGSETHLCPERVPLHNPFNSQVIRDSQPGCIRPSHHHPSRLSTFKASLRIVRPPFESTKSSQGLLVFRALEERISQRQGAGEKCVGYATRCVCLSSAERHPQEHS